MIDPTLATALLIIASSGVLVVLIFTVLYIRLNRKVVLLSAENEQLKQGPAVEAAKIIDASRVEAKRIIEVAQQQAQKVIKDSQFFTKDLTDHVRQTTEDAISEGDKLYKSVLNEVKEVGEKQITEASSRLTAESVNELTDLKTQLAKEFQSEHQQLKTEVAAYKNEQLGEVAQKAQGMLDKIVLKALGHGLKGEDHVELIKKALLEVAHEYES